MGIELNLDSSVLEIIRENYATHHNKTEECCKAMIKKWLKIDVNATWEKLFKAIDNVEAISQTSSTLFLKSETIASEQNYSMHAYSCKWLEIFSSPL